MWARGTFLRQYASRELRPAERLLVSRYHDRLSGRVLELGCGAGRLTGHLLGVADSVVGVDVSERMVGYCRRAYPRGRYEVLDLREVLLLGEESADAVVATYNVLDVLGPAERHRVLCDIERVLAPGGLLIMSSHNLDFIPRLRSPTDLRARNILRRAGRLALLPVRMRNRRALLALERSGAGYAIVNDDAHQYRLLHYYVSRDAQERQLREVGFEFLECVDADGGAVHAGGAPQDCVELFYVATRAHALDAAAGPQPTVRAARSSRGSTIPSAISPTA